MPAPAKDRWRVLVDFDDTLTRRDADYDIVEALLPADRGRAYLPLAEAYERLEISTREYFEGWLRLLEATPRDIARAAARLPLRDGAGALLDYCREQAMDVSIVSEGLDIYVHPVLRANGIHGAEVSCNRAIQEGGRWRVEAGVGAEPCSRCLNCKGAHVSRARREGVKVAVVGNGASDLCAARLADFVAARDTLLEHCSAEEIPHTTWRSLHQVITLLRRLR